RSSAVSSTGSTASWPDPAPVTLQRSCNASLPTVVRHVTSTTTNHHWEQPMTVHAQPGTDGSDIAVASRYGHFIGGEFVDPVKGQYFENISPVNGKPFTEIARGTAEDIEAALDAAHAAAPAWGRTSPAERANILNKIADRMEAN